MRQSKLLKKIYRASFLHDLRIERELFLKEISKISKRREAGKEFNPKWTNAD